MMPVFQFGVRFVCQQATSARARGVSNFFATVAKVLPTDRLWAKAYRSGEKELVPRTFRACVPLNNWHVGGRDVLGRFLQGCWGGFGSVLGMFWRGSGTVLRR